MHTTPRATGRWRLDTFGDAPVRRMAIPAGDVSLSGRWLFTRNRMLRTDAAGGLSTEGLGYGSDAVGRTAQPMHGSVRCTGACGARFGWHSEWLRLALTPSADEESAWKRSRSQLFSQTLRPPTFSRSNRSPQQRSSSRFLSLERFTTTGSSLRTRRSAWCERSTPTQTRCWLTWETWVSFLDDWSSSVAASSPKGSALLPLSSLRQSLHSMPRCTGTFRASRAAGDRASAGRFP